jgi:hypothetical protein
VTTAAFNSAPAQNVTLDLVAELCGAGECPTIYRTGRGTLVIQGYQFDPEQAGTTVPAGEQMVEIPVELVARYLSAVS